MVNRHGLSFKPVIEPPEEYPRAVPVVHLHGRFVADDQEGGESVLTERDYAKWNKHNRNIGADGKSSLFEYMRSRFEKGATVFVGTSMRDANVFDALYDTANDDAWRVALQPYQSEMRQGDSVGASPKVVAALAKLNDARLRSFDVQTIRPDFYGQVSQFLHELRLLVEPKPEGEQPIADYMTRIRQWSKDWKVMRDSATTHLDFDLAIASKLGKRLRAILGDSDHRITSAKLEVWARTEPLARTLDLVGTSTSVWVGGEEVERYCVPIAHLSEYVSVEAFASRGAVSGKLIPGSTHWTRYVAVPIILLGHPWHELPVGVIGLLMETDRSLRSIYKTLGYRSEQHLAFELQRFGGELLTVTSPLC